MEQELEKKIQELMSRMLDVKDQLASLEEREDRNLNELKACRDAVEGVADNYRDILAAAPEGEKDFLERRYGRKVIDLRRDASWLPEQSHGKSVPLATGSQWSRAIFEEPPEPEPATTLPPPIKAPAIHKGPRVGGEVEAWCGSCKGLRQHTIVAMVGDEPKQVICQSCDAKHGYRLTPARGKKKTTPTKKRGKLTPEEAKRLRDEEERTAFQKELAEAKDVRPFARRGRYKAGQIIEHPEHGRGKIESVVKGSLLVRFRSGLRPISLV